MHSYIIEIVSQRKDMITKYHLQLELLSFKNEQKKFWNSRLTMIILWTTEIRRKLA